MKKILLVMPDSNLFIILIPKGPNVWLLHCCCIDNLGTEWRKDTIILQQDKTHFISLCFSICELVLSDEMK